MAKDVAPKKESNAEKLERMNREHVVVMFGSKVKVVRWVPTDTQEEVSEYNGVSPRDLMVPSYLDQTAMKMFYANQQIAIKSKGENGEDKVTYKGLFEYWLTRPDRPSATGVCLDADEPRISSKGMLNMWRGLAIEGKRGKWPRLAWHIDNIIAAGDFDHGTYIHKWLAWVLQNPTGMAETILVLKGEKGTGKGMFLALLYFLFGEHALQVSNRKQVVGNFNAHLQQTALLYVNEAVWGGDKEGDSQLKRIVTDKTLFIEPKGIDGYDTRNHLSIVMDSNEDWVVPAGEKERRYAVFQVSSEKAQDHEYFNALRKELYEQGGAAAFLYDMLHLDLKGWHPRQDVPQTEALHGQQEESAKPIVHWIGNLLQEGHLPYEVRGDDGEVEKVVAADDPSLFRVGLLHRIMRKNLQGGQFIHETTFGKVLEAHGAHLHKRASVGVWRKFVPLQEARALFRKKYPWWPAWSDHTEHWQFGRVRPASDFDTDDAHHHDQPGGF